MLLLLLLLSLPTALVCRPWLQLDALVPPPLVLVLVLRVASAASVAGGGNSAAAAAGAPPGTWLHCRVSSNKCCSAGRSSLPACRPCPPHEDGGAAACSARSRAVACLERANIVEILERAQTTAATAQGGFSRQAGSVASGAASARSGRPPAVARSLDTPSDIYVG